MFKSYLLPGGHFEEEYLDLNVGCDDGTLRPDGPTNVFFTELCKAYAEHAGASAVDLPTKLNLLKQAGFENVEASSMRLPLSIDKYRCEVCSTWGPSPDGDLKARHGCKKCCPWPGTHSGNVIGTYYRGAMMEPEALEGISNAAFAIYGTKTSIPQGELIEGVLKETASGKVHASHTL